ncbi:hypothetical protein PFISCL1PPCAC_12837, partial [Pristionchus fissidentatus]
ESVCVTCMTSMGALGVTINLLLLTAIRKRSPLSMKRYSFILVNAAIIDMIGASATMLTVPREHVGSFGALIVFYGLGSLVNKLVCHVFLGTLYFYQRTSTILTVEFVLLSAPIVFLSSFIMRVQIVTKLNEKRGLMSSGSHSLHKMLLN